MLKELCKNDKKWREIAFKLCSDKALADDIVQDMYLKSLRYNKPLNDAYIYFMLKCLFLDYCRKKNNNSMISIENLHFIKDNVSLFEIDDNDLEILNRYDNLDWKQKELIEMSYDKSLRQIEKEFPLINYAFAFRAIKAGRNKILNRDK